MKRLISFTGLFLFMATSLLFTSCGGDDKKTEPASPTTDTTATPVVTVNTIVTTPQLMALIKHKVKDFASWKALYDGHDSARLAN